jgi:hypothetical protein
MHSRRRLCKKQKRLHAQYIIINILIAAVLELQAKDALKKGNKRQASAYNMIARCAF